MVTQNIFLGPKELKLILTLESEGKKAFMFSYAKEILRTSNTSVRNVIYRLKKKNRITEIEKGRYVLSPARSGLEGLWVEHPFLIVPGLIDEYYIGFWSAMNYWGMTEQIPRTVFVATTRRKRNIEYGNQEFRFIILSRKKFFGSVQEKIEDFEFNISSREKTIVDGLMHPEYCGGISEVAKAIRNAGDELNWSKLLRIVSRVSISAVDRRLGYLLDVMEIRKDIAQKLSKKGFVGFRWLDPSGEKKILRYSKRWGLMVNVEEKDLTG